MTVTPDDQLGGRQRAAARAWERTVAAVGPATGVGPQILSSWQRSQEARVEPTLARAPVLCREEELERRRQDAEWLTLARSVLLPHLPLIGDSGHVLTLFGPDGAMLHSDGDPRVLEVLKEIHFMPGACWAEALVGTNGPGTALATGRPVHVIGAEHYVEAWQPWHCAAVPVRAPGSGLILGALDLSGYRERADGFALSLASALTKELEAQLVLRHEARCRRVLQHFAELAAHFPSELALALDASGRVLAANPRAKRRFELERLHLPTALEHDGLLSGTSLPAELQGAQVTVVREGAQPIGACVLVPERPRAKVTPTTRYSFRDLIGVSGRFREAERLARAAAAQRLPVLIQGESGVGKELFAQAIHGLSSRSGQAFVPVNCAALPSGLIESELFGYVGGAFSGASPEGRGGKFQAADRGTLFLDEVGELPPAAQAVLLRVLQEGEVTPVGAHRATPCDVRVIAATNRPLLAEVEAGRFRLDLYHRLAVLAVEIPPLRERPEDLPSLIHHLLEVAAAETGRRIDLHREAEAQLLAYPWPGNVRELKNVLTRLAATSPQALVMSHDLPSTLQQPSVSAPPEDAEVARLKSAVDRSRTMAEAARLLGITRSTLYRQLDRFGLTRKKVVEPEG